MSVLRVGLIVCAVVMCGASVLSTAACDRLPGRPAVEAVAAEGTAEWTTQVFNTSCRGCHAQGKEGSAVPLMDSEYWRAATDAQVVRAVLEGQGVLMPAFGPAAGGPFTPSQANALASGMRALWGGGLKPSTAISGTVQAGSADRGKSVFETACASCHGSHGSAGSGGSAGSVTDPMYLRLISDQGLWTAVVAGRAALGSPAWNMPMPGRPSGLASAEVADVVAYLSSLRPRSASELKP